jgi:hypothetical protein
VSCALSAIFSYTYRAGLSLQDPELANLALVVGFIFLVARATHHTAVYLSNSLLRQHATALQLKNRALKRLLTNLLEFQVSMIAVVSYLLSPIASLVIFSGQTPMYAAAVARALTRRDHFEAALGLLRDHGAVVSVRTARPREGVSLRDGDYGGAVPRERVVFTQTPQAYRREILLETFRQAEPLGWRRTVRRLWLPRRASGCAFSRARRRI